MKNIFFILMVSLSLLLASCAKDSKIIDRNNQRLMGTWHLDKAILHPVNSDKGSDASGNYHYTLTFTSDGNVLQQFNDSAVSYGGTYVLGKSTLIMNFRTHTGNAHHAILLSNLTITKKQIDANDFEPDGNYHVIWKK